MLDHLKKQKCQKYVLLSHLLYTRHYLPTLCVYYCLLFILSRIGSSDWSSTRTLMRNGEYGEGRWSPGDGKGERGEGNRNGEKEYKKGIVILLFTCATPGTPASTVIYSSSTLTQLFCYVYIFTHFSHLDAFLYNMTRVGYAFLHNLLLLWACNINPDQ